MQFSKQEQIYYYTKILERENKTTMLLLNNKDGLLFLLVTDSAQNVLMPIHKFSNQRTGLSVM